MGSQEKLEIERGLELFITDNKDHTERHVETNIDISFIQFHFCVKGDISLAFNGGRYALDLQANHSLFLYNPKRPLPFTFIIPPKALVVSILISIQKFHSLFSTEAGYISFLSDDNQNNKYYSQDQTDPSKQIILNQLLRNKIHPSLKKLYAKAKIYEMLALYFNRTEEDLNKCPFLADHENVVKIKKAKDIIVANMVNPPSLPELAEQVDISLKKLKMGFKELYGDSVYSFLLDYKMEFARKLLETGNYNVNEVGHEVGYSTSSHFIAAFRKKFGITPKQFLMSLATN